MLKKIETPSCNIYSGVEFILRGAKKRRSMALASARMLTNEQGVQTMLVAVKQLKAEKAKQNVCKLNVWVEKIDSV